MSKVPPAMLPASVCAYGLQNMNAANHFTALLFSFASFFSSLSGNYKDRKPLLIKFTQLLLLQMKS